MTCCLETAKLFARALDAEDYVAAAALLSPACRYTCRDATYIGPESLLETYRQSGERARRDFDQVFYESHCEQLDDAWVLIHFVDRLTKRGRSFTFECLQRVQMNESGQIVRIEHQDLPGRREDLTKFKQSVGLGD